MKLPESLQIVQEKVPLVKVHQKVYIAAILLMVVYIAVGKFVLRFCAGVINGVKNCINAIHYRIKTSCFYIFLARNLRAVGHKLGKCCKNKRAISQFVQG